MQRFARIAMSFVVIAVAAPNSLKADPSIADIGSQSVRVAPVQTLKVRGQKVASLPSASIQTTGFGTPHWITVARRYKGTNPTSRKNLWCADFLNLVLQRSGMQGTSSSMASSFQHYGQRISGPQVGAIAVITRGKTAGHVGIVTGVDGNGNPILISGNHNNTVAEAAYPAGRVIAYVWPNG
jgi:uncharacterized protein (TIGR02594 family)